MKTHLTVFFRAPIITRYPQPVNKPARIFRLLTPPSSFTANRPILSTPTPKLAPPAVKSQVPQRHPVSRQFSHHVIKCLYEHLITMMLVQSRRSNTSTSRRNNNDSTKSVPAK